MKHLLILFFCTTFLFFQIPKSLGQGIPGGGAERSDKGFSFMPIPYINYNRSLGFTIGFLPMAMYNLSKKDTISPSSISGGLGMYTSNDSWFAMLFNKWYFKEDKYRAVAVGGRGNINFQFFLEHPISPGYIDYTTEADFIKIELQRKIVSDLYFGINYTYAHMFTTFETEGNLEDDTFLHGIGAVVSNDKRDNVYYPYKGYMSNINYISFPELLDNTSVSNKIMIDHNHYFNAHNKRDVIATRFYGGFGIGDLQFNQQFVVGNDDIRGYSLGKYRGEQTIAMQGEYRLNPFKKIGFVGFFGLATIFNSPNEEHNGRVLPGIGTGFRYNVFPKNHMNVGIDVAAGIDDWGFYFRVGEAF